MRRRKKNLGVEVSAELNVGKQCSKAAGKGNQILGMIRRTFVNREKKIIIPLHVPFKASFRLLQAGLESLFKEGYSGH